MLSGILGIIVMIAIYGVVFIDYRQQRALKTRDVNYTSLNRNRGLHLVSPLPKR
ncbi:hypothetical protein Desaci_0368 [Desulfosporosinus acidiphilus SJ4]|uniref:Uncharacterized protein n=1 Tax=Desulfosporosinus acidiphilus (strain DSM 22704 / JCM 16185 / SJ4) TaxID=646529 RepID=I4D0W2_DESAJ|nr:hypothetical protein Desaci_0368 [Desulfosporosinus acidiphilus SJ4]